MQINSMASLFQLFQFLYANSRNPSQTTGTTQAPTISPQSFVDLFGGNGPGNLPFNMPPGGINPVSFRSNGPNSPSPSPSPSPGPGTDPQSMLGLQEKTDKEQEQMQLLSNLQKKKHDTCMAIIANIR